MTPPGTPALQSGGARPDLDPVDLPKPLAQTITRLQTATSGLTASQASTLRRIVNGAQVFQRNIGKEEQLVLGAPKNMGCVELDASAQYQPTEDLRLALPDCLRAGSVGIGSMHGVGLTSRAQLSNCGRTPQLLERGFVPLLHLTAGLSPEDASWRGRGDREA